MKTGIIGTGNMGKALVKGVISSGKIKNSNFAAYDKNETLLSDICGEYGLIQAESSRELVKMCDVVILVVKPNIVETVLEEIKEAYDGGKIFIGIAAGIPISLYEKYITVNSKIARVMPNTPALVNEGMTAVSFSGGFKREEKKLVLDMFESVGLVEEFEEKYMNQITALIGSSPAYAYMFIEAMADAAVKEGLPRDKAYKLASQAVLGSAKMVLETKMHPGVLKDQVCSPGGTTIEAVAYLEKAGFRSAVIEAINRCVKKADLLGEKYNERS